MNLINRRGGSKLVVQLVATSTLSGMDYLRFAIDCGASLHAPLFGGLALACIDAFFKSNTSIRWKDGSSA